MLHAAVARLRRSLDIVLPLLLLMAMAVLYAADPRLLAAARVGVFDSYQRLVPRAYQPLPVRIVDIDDDSLAQIGQWPWSRARLALLVRKVQEMGAAAVALDIVLAEPDRTAPKALAAAWPDTPEWQGAKDQLARLPDPDLELAAALGTLPSVTAFAGAQRRQGVPRLAASMAFAGDDPSAALPAFTGAVASLPELERAASGNGAVNTVPEPDGVLRRVPLLVAVAGRVMPGLAAELLRVAQGAPGRQVLGRQRREPDLRRRARRGGAQDRPGRGADRRVRGSPPLRQRHPPGALCPGLDGAGRQGGGGQPQGLPGADRHQRGRASGFAGNPA
jgi:adenylate cyclase